MNYFLRRFWLPRDAGEVVEYATILATILILVVGTLHLVGINSGEIFSTVADTLLHPAGGHPAH